MRKHNEPPIVTHDINHYYFTVRISKDSVTDMKACQNPSVADEILNVITAALKDEVKRIVDKHGEEKNNGLG